MGILQSSIQSWIYTIVARMWHTCVTFNTILSRMWHPCVTFNTILTRMWHPCAGLNTILTRMSHTRDMLNTTLTRMWHTRANFFFIVRRAGLMRSQQDSEMWWSVPFTCAWLYTSFLLFCLICVYSSQLSILFWIMYLLLHFGYLPIIKCELC